jgi:hypothetical protein
VDSSNLVKVVGAFVGGLVVALGSALIYVKVTDSRPTQPIAQTVDSPQVAKALPNLESDDAARETTSAAAVTDTAPAEPAPQPLNTPKPRRRTVERHRRMLKAVFSKPTQIPVQIARTPAVPPAAPIETEPSQAQPAATVDASNAQDQAAYSAAPIPSAPQPHVVTFPAGTVLSVRLAETLSTEHNYSGDTFRATLMSDLIQDGFIIADRGSKVLGRVVNSQPAGHMGNVAVLSLTLSEINTTDGQRVRVQTTVFDVKGNSNVGQDAAKIAGGAALGALIGGLAGGGKGAAIGAGAGGAAGTGAVLLTHGKPAALESETQLTFRLANPLTITEKLN